MNEDPRHCLKSECLPCSFLRELPGSAFFPRLALSTLRGYKAYQFANGGFRGSLALTFCWNSQRYSHGPNDLA